MSGESKPRFPWLRTVLSFLLTLAVGTGGMVLGIELFGDARWTVVVRCLCTGLLVLLTILGALGGAFYTRKMNKLNVRGVNDLVDAQKAHIEADVATAWQALRRNCLWARVYYYGFGLLALAVCLLSGCGGEVSYSVMVLGDLTLWAYIEGLVFPQKPQAEPECVPEGEFPRLYALAREAAGEARKHVPLRIWLLSDIPDSECSAAVSFQDGKIDLYLGIMTLNVLTEGELRQVLLHEFSHLDQQDSQRQVWFSKTMELLTGTGSTGLTVFPALACGYLSSRLSLQGQLYFLLSSRERERQADEQAARQGDAELQASALAKTACHSLWVFEREPCEAFYATPEHPRDLMARRVADYRKALAEREEDWKAILEQELPSRVDTHPTFRQRWQELGCCAYSLTTRDGDTPLARECQDLLSHVDENLAKIPGEVYQQYRKENYEEPLALVTKWEKTGELLSPDEMRPILMAYLNLGQPDKMEALCDRILEGEDGTSAIHFATYWKGKLLLYRYDKNGIDYIYKAMEANENYIQPGLDAIGEFCTRMGLEEELEEYRRRAPELMQHQQDRQSQGLTRTKLAPETLPEGWVEKIRNVAREASQGQLEKLYLVKELVSEDYQPSAFVLRFSEECDEETVQAAYDRVFALLDDWPGGWEFDLYAYEPEMEKALSRVPGSCVYEKEETKL